MTRKLIEERTHCKPNCEKGFRAGLVALLQCHFRTLYLCSNAQKRNLIKIGCVECRLWYVEAGKGKSFKAQWNFQSLHVWNMQNTKLKKSISNLIFNTKFSGQFYSSFSIIQRIHQFLIKKMFRYLIVFKGIW